VTTHSGRPPRVLYFTDTYPPQVNGVSVVTALSVEGLIDRGWECSVVAPLYDAHTPRIGRGPRTEIVTSIPSVPMPVYPEIRLSAPDAATVATAIRVFEPDIVHCATEFVIGAIGHRAARRAGIPVVSSYHTDFGRSLAAYGVPWLRGTVNSYIARFHPRRAMTFSPSEPPRQTHLRMGVRSATVWGRGVDTAMFTPERRDDGLRAAYAGTTPFIFLHVGRLAAEKGVDRLLEAFAMARRMLAPGRIHFIIAGSGPEERALRSAGGPDVTFLGVLDRERMLPRLYASADAVLFAAQTETLGLVILEAMASRLPVIAIPAGGVADHLRHLQNGLAVPPNDPVAMATAMVEMAMNSGLREQLARGARRTAESLSWDAELDRLDVSYRGLIHPPIARTRVA